MLRCHLKFFVDPEGSVQTDMCVAKDGISSHVVEPLGQLIQAILQVNIVNSLFIIILNIP